MAGDYVKTITDDMAGGGTHSMTFRPGLQGAIDVSAAILDPIRQSASDPVYAFSITLQRPDRTTAGHAATKKGETAVAFSYEVTAADLALRGDWTCQINNASGTKAGTLHTTVRYQTGWPLRTASFDLQLLGLLIQQGLRVAQPKLHLQSSTDQNLSEVTWSAAAAQLAGRASYSFPLGEIATSHKVLGVSVPLSYWVVSLDTQSITGGVTFGSIPSIHLDLVFETSGVELQGATSHTPDIDIRALSGSIDINFDGTITAQFQASARTDDGGIDASADLENTLANKARTQVSPAQVRKQIDKFVSILMRFDATAEILGYAGVNNALVVTYAEPPPAIVVRPGPVHPPIEAR